MSDADPPVNISRTSPVPWVRRRSSPLPPSKTKPVGVVLLANGSPIELPVLTKESGPASPQNSTRRTSLPLLNRLSGPSPPCIRMWSTPDALFWKASISPPPANSRVPTFSPLFWKRSGPEPPTILSRLLPLPQLTSTLLPSPAKNSIVPVFLPFWYSASLSSAP